MSTPRPQTAEDKLVEMFEKMIDDFCETHSQDEIEAMFSKCDDIFDGIEKRHRAEGVAAPLEPTPEKFCQKWLSEHVKPMDQIVLEDFVEYGKAYAAAASLEPSQERLNFVANLEHDWIVQQHILDFRNWLIEKLWVAAAFSKNLQEELVLAKSSNWVNRRRADAAEGKLERLESEITALREKPL